MFLFRYPFIQTASVFFLVFFLSTLRSAFNTVTFTFNHLADAFIQSDLQMRRTIEEIRPSREQQLKGQFTHTYPPLVSNLYEFLSSVEHKRRCFETKQLTVAIDFHSMEKKNNNTMEANSYQSF